LQGLVRLNAYRDVWRHPGPGLDAGTSQISLQASSLEHGRRFDKRHDDDLRLMRILQLHHRGDEPRAAAGSR